MLFGLIIFILITYVLSNEILYFNDEGLLVITLTGVLCIVIRLVLLTLKTFSNENSLRMTNAIHFHLRRIRTEMLSTKRTLIHVKSQLNQYIKLSGLIQTYIDVSMGISKALPLLLIAQASLDFLKEIHFTIWLFWKQSYLKDIIQLFLLKTKIYSLEESKSNLDDDNRDSDIQWYGI